MFTFKLDFLSKGFLPAMVFLVVGFHSILYSQTKENYELLWEIQHKDSDKKSYLFGTMHLKDKRLFDFSDAMLPAIQSTDAFALELHPDSFLEAIEGEFEGSEIPAMFKRVLTEEEYRQLEERFFRYNGYPLENFSGKNFLYIEPMLNPEIVKDDDVFTVLDSFLFAIADSFDKEIYGLEELKDQMPSPEGVSDEEIREYIQEILKVSEEDYKVMIENMVQIYSRGNLTEIFEFMGKDTLDPTLKYRNRIMTNSIIEITNNKTLFAAVGAAHLPGESGIIEMLRRDGYTVNKVESPFTGLSNDFVPKPNLNKWVNQSYPELGFSIKLPSRPISFPLENNFELKASFDLISANQYAYLVMDVDGKIKEGQSPEEITETFINYFMEGEHVTIESKQIIQKNSAEFLEVLFFKDSKYHKIQTGLSNNILYFFYTENTNSKNLNSEYTNAFFNSITIHPTIERTTVWKDYHEEMGAYAIKFPNDNLQDFSREIANPYEAEGEPIKLYILAATDPDTKSNYLIRYNDQPLGYFLESESASLLEFKEYFQTAGRLLYEEPRQITTNGQKGYEFEGYLQEVNHFIARVYFRGNRVYFLLALKDSETEKVNASNPFFNSFEFVEYTTPQFDNTISFDKNYEITIPGNSNSADSEDIYENTPFYKPVYYFGKNLNTGAILLIEHAKSKDYFKINSKEEFYTTLAEAFKEEGDSIILNEHFKIKGLDALKVYIKNENSNLLQRIAVVLDNDNLFTLQVHSSPEKQEDDFSNVFFNNFRKKVKKDYYDLYSNKTPLIIKNLTSKNTQKQTKALEAFDYYIFEEADLPLLESALLKSFDDDENYFGSKNLLIRELGIIGSSKSIKILKDLYENQQTKNIQKIAILEAIAQIETPEALDVYTHLLFNSPPALDEELSFNGLSGLYHDDFRVSDHKENLLALLNQPSYRGEIISSLAYGIKSDSLALPSVKQNLENWLQFFFEDATTYVDEFSNQVDYPQFSYSSMDHYLFLIDTLKQNSQHVLKGLDVLTTQLDDSNWIKTKAIITSIQNGIEPNKMHFEKALDTLFSRFEVMEALVKTNQIGVIPKSYLDGVAFSELSLFNYVGFYTTYPKDIRLLGDFYENNKKFYAFSFVDEYDPEDQYLAVVEDTPVDFNNFIQNPVFFEGDYLNENWEEQAKNMVLEYSYFSE